MGKASFWGFDESLLISAKALLLKEPIYKRIYVSCLGYLHKEN